MHNWVHRWCKGYGRHSKWHCRTHKVAQEVVNIHCVINRRALEDKKLGNEENYQLADVIKIVNATLNSPKKSHEFDELVIEIGGDRHFLYHSEVCWIFHERVMERVWNLRQEFLV